MASIYLNSLRLISISFNNGGKTLKIRSRPMENITRTLRLQRLSQMEWPLGTTCIPQSHRFRRYRSLFLTTTIPSSETFLAESLRGALIISNWACCLNFAVNRTSRTVKHLSKPIYTVKYRACGEELLDSGYHFQLFLTNNLTDANLNSLYSYIVHIFKSPKLAATS